MKFPRMDDGPATTRSNLRDFPRTQIPFISLFDTLYLEFSGLYCLLAI
jgi:hypothetical protein